MSIVDLDSVFKNSYQNITAKFNTAQIGLSLNENEPMWNRHSAAMMYLNGSDRSKHFLKNICLFINENIKNNCFKWFIDQTGIFSTVSLLSEELSTVFKFFSKSDNIISTSCNETSDIWTVVNNDKYKETKFSRYQKKLIDKHYNNSGIDQQPKQVSRYQISFLVEPLTNRSAFWDSFTKNNWEQFTLDSIKKYLKPHHQYIDIGAWIGPTVLYAAQIAQNTYAFEPDPIAFGQRQLFSPVNDNYFFRF